MCVYVVSVQCDKKALLQRKADPEAYVWCNICANGYAISTKNHFENHAKKHAMDPVYKIQL